MDVSGHRTDRAGIRALLARYRRGRLLADAHQAAVSMGLRPPTLGQIRMRGEAREGISQRELGALLGYTERQVRNWESGAAVPPPEVVRQLPAILGMDARGARWLRELAYPDPHATDPMDPYWAGYVHQIQAPAFLATDVTWEVVVANDAYYRLFPWAAPWAERPEPSLLRAVVLRPEARDTLVRWRTDWAEPTVDMLWSTLQVYPRHTRLRALVDGVLQDPEARRLWEERESSREPRLNQGVELRRVRHPEEGEQEVVLLISTPESLRGYRLMVMAPPQWVVRE